MKKILQLTVLVSLFTVAGCGPKNTGELTGVPGRRPWFHPQPYGTIYVPTGTFHTGQSDQDIFQSYIQPNKQVTIAAFFMDDTEITNNEYRQFVYHVLDSIARFIIGEPYIMEDADGNQVINYEERFDMNSEENAEALAELYYQGNDVFFKQKQIDVDKLKYYYEWEDLKLAASFNPSEMRARRSEVIKKTPNGGVKIYPDTLVWIRDFTYSFNDPMTRNYFWHPKYDDYPVVGVNWHQANAFCMWRTQLLNSYYRSIEEPTTEFFRLPSEWEWEYAARGGRDNNMYPWGGPYTRNSKGCFLANFKPNRGNYIDDGGLYPVRANAYFPNDYGLYNMAGNVAEWTRNAYDESSNMFTHDMNPDYVYDAKDDEPMTKKRKVIRGGSWKDIAYFIQNGSRTYEYQDTSKSYIGFRCVMSYIGRSITDKN